MFWRELNIDTIPKQSTCKILTHYHEKKKKSHYGNQKSVCQEKCLGSNWKTTALKFIMYPPSPKWKEQNYNNIKKTLAPQILPLQLKRCWYFPNSCNVFVQLYNNENHDVHRLFHFTLLHETLSLLKHFVIFVFKWYNNLPTGQIRILTILLLCDI